MLEINPQLLLLTTGLFLLLIYVLNMILFKPLLNFVDKRNEGIAKEEEELLKYGNDTKKYEAEAEQIIAKAREEVLVIKSTAMQKVSEEAKERINNRKLELEKEYKQFESNLKAEHEALKVDLQAYLPQIRQDLKNALSKL